MTNKKVTKQRKLIGRVVGVSPEDSVLLKQHFLDLEKKGVNKSRKEISDDIFSIGLHAVVDRNREDI